MQTRSLIAYFLTCGTAALAHGSVVEFTDKAAWESAVGSFTTLDFVLPPSGTPLSDQYAHMGVNLEGVLWSHQAGGYLNDGWGLRSANFGGGAWVHFDTPQHWVAVDYPGAIRIELFREGKSIYLSSEFEVSGPSGVGGFAGLLSSEVFDEVNLFRMAPPQFDNIYIDDLHFGALVPGAGGLALLALAAFAGRRKRTA